MFFVNYFQNKKKELLHLQLNIKIGFLKKKGKLMKNKTFFKECNCAHCQRKLDQIKSSRLYWDKLTFNKIQPILS